MPRTSRYALVVFLFSALIFAGLLIPSPQGAGASSSHSGRAVPRGGEWGYGTDRKAYLLSFDPSGLLLAAPSIDGVSPSSVPRSGLLRVNGSGFGATQGTGQLLVGGETPAFIAHWSDSLILAYVPEGAALGDVPVQVTTDEGTGSANVNVTSRQTNGRIRWDFTFASDPAPHRPAVAADGTVYVQDIVGRLYALAPDGGLKWVFQAGAGGGRGPVSVGADGTVYAPGSVPKDPAQACSDPALTNVDAVFAVNSDGTEKWVFKQTCQRLIAGPTVGPDGKVYGVTDKDGLGAFALTNAGALAWSGGNFSEPTSKGQEIVFGPASAGDAPARGYFQFSQEGLFSQSALFGYSFDGAEVFWKALTNDGKRPTVGALTGNLYVTTGGGAGSQVRSWTPQGTHRWFSNAYPEVSFSELDAAPDETLYITQDGHFLHQLSPASGGTRWTYYESEATVFNTPAASPDNRLALVVGHAGSGGSGFADAVGADGRLIWKQQLPDVPGLFPGGQARATARASFTGDAQTAYVSTETAGDESLAETQRRGRLFALDTSTGAVAENRAPTVTLTNPVNLAYVAQNTNIELTATVSDSGPVSRVDFYRTSGGVTTLVGSDATAPYSVPYNTGDPGEYKFQAVATDAGGLTGYSAAHTLRVVNEGPRTTFIAPTEGQWFPSGSTITITVRATDIDGQITQVEFLSSRGGALGVDTTPDEQGNYSVQYSPRPGTSQEGTQQIWAHPTDDDGHRGGWYVNITVGGTPPPTPTPTPTPTPNPNPGVRIVSPAHGSSFSTGSIVQLSVEAVDANGVVANVKLYSAPSDALLGTDTTAPFSFSLTDQLPNVYNLYAVATNDAGLSTTSATVQITFYDAEAPYFINGQIRHAQSTSGNPIYLPNALVKLNKEGAPFREARTDSFGNYTFDHLPPDGSYTVVPSEPGYEFAPAAASVPALDDSRTFDFTASGPLPPPPAPMPTPGAVLQWERFHDNGLNTHDLDPVLTVDRDGNTIVAGKSNVPTGGSSDTDISVVKYDPSGQKLWSRRYAGAGAYPDWPAAVRADANGNVYVFGTEHGGHSSNYNFVTIKYAPDGTELWVRTYNGPLGRWDLGAAMELDAAGNVLVTGLSETTYADSPSVVSEYATVKYDPLGNRKWVNRHSTAHVTDHPADITTDAAGNVYVTGLANTQRAAGAQDAVTIKYTPGGARAWVAQYNGKAGVLVNDSGVAVRHDGRGGLYVAGDSQPGSTSRDFFLAKYNDATGALVWSRNWAGPDTDNLKDMAIDAAGNVVVTGESIDRSVPSATTSSNFDVATIKFDGAGNQLWARTYAGTPGRIDTPLRVVLDAVGNAYVGLRTDGEPYKYTTAVIKYLANGTEAWVYRYDQGVSHTMTDMEIDAAGSIYATGYASTTQSADLATFKLLASSPGLNLPPDVIISVGGPTIVGITDSDSSPSPGGPTIVGRSLTLHADARDGDGVVSRVDFYDGSTLLGTDTAAPYSFVWEDPAPGTHSVTATATDNFGAARTSQPVSVTVSGDTTPTPTPTPTPTITPTPTPTPVPTPSPTPTSLPSPTPTPLPTPTPASTPTPTPTPTPEAPNFVTTDAPTFDEDSAAVAITVRRTGDLSQPAAVDYSTADGTAREGYDYIMASGTLLFAPGEGARQVGVLIINDAHGEPDEAFTLTLSNPSGGVPLGSPHAAALTIKGNDASSGSANPVDEVAFFVREHYADFLNREPDEGGQQFWSDEIESCGANAQCREAKRVNVSAAFFLAIEFQETGYLVYRLQKATDGRMPRYAAFLRDTQEIGSGVVVGTEGWGEKLGANQLRFVENWVRRADFRARYDSLSNQQYVDALAANAGAALDAAARAELVAALDAGTETRAGVLRRVADHESVRRAELNRAFVLMQYFGYLRRDPDEAGYNHWLDKLNRFNGNYIKAEMVRAFLDSFEYRQRFGP